MVIVRTYKFMITILGFISVICETVGVLGISAYGRISAVNRYQFCN